MKSKASGFVWAALLILPILVVEAVGWRIAVAFWTVMFAGSLLIKLLNVVS